MDKIYVVTSGSYSDYEIDGVFSDKEMAQAFCDQFQLGEVEEYNLNPIKLDIKSDLQPYSVLMDIKGRTLRAHRIYDHDMFLKDKRYSFELPDALRNYCFAKDRGHAIKLTNELRTQLIANNEWQNA